MKNQRINMDQNIKRLNDTINHLKEILLATRNLETYNPNFIKNPDIIPSEILDNTITFLSGILFGMETKKTNDENQATEIVSN